MANARRRRSRTRKSRRRLSHPGVWLATLSTVVGIATGMFTLRDQVLPHESGSAQAALTDYQTSVGGVCLAVNEGESARARDARDLARRLRRADSISAQRDVLLDSTNRRIAQLVHEISKLSALSPPKELAAKQHAIRAAWERNLERIRDYAHHLDGAGTRAQLAAALDVLYRHRVALSRDGVSVRKEISKLGGHHCHLGKPIVTPNVTVPELAGGGDDASGGSAARRDRDDDEVSGTSSTPASGNDDASGSSATAPGGSGGGSAVLPRESGGGSATPPADDSASPPGGSGDSNALDSSATPPGGGADDGGSGDSNALDSSATPPGGGADDDGGGG